VAGSASYRRLPEMLRALEEAEASAAAKTEIPRAAAAPPPAKAGGLPEDGGLRDDASVVTTAGKLAGKSAGSSTVKSSGQKPVADSLVRITGLDDRETD